MTPTPKAPAQQTAPATSKAPALAKKKEEVTNNNEIFTSYLNDPELQAFSEQLEIGLQKENPDKLPFSTLLAWVLTGQDSYKDRKGPGSAPQYFGGWIFNANDANRVMQEVGATPIKGLEKFTRNPPNSPAFEAYGARSLIILPIRLRKCWENERTNTRYPVNAEPVEGSKSHVHLLALIGERLPDNQIRPWMPAILSAKSHQAAKLEKALAEWRNAVYSILLQSNPKAPSSITNLFWRSMGTFGPQPEKEMVGKGKQSPITPIHSNIPANLDLQILMDRFAGKNPECMELVHYLFEKSLVWQQAWDKSQPESSEPIYIDTEPSEDYQAF
ncbi:MAG: hypothetical protein AB9888_15480 [Bacteroidales bacterium]